MSRGSRTILMVGSYPPPYGGVPRYIEELAPFLAGRGWKVHVLASGHSGTRSAKGVTVHKERRIVKLGRVARAVVRGDWRAMQGLSFERGLHQAFQLSAQASLGRELVTHHGIDVIAVFNLMRLPVGLHLSRLFNIPLVIANFGETYSSGALLRRRLEVVSDAVQRAALVSMSRHCADSYREIGMSPNVTVIPIGIDTSRFAPTVSGVALRARLGIAPEHRIVLFLGRMVRDMGLDTVLSAIPRIRDGLPGARFLVAGGRGELYEHVRALANDTASGVHVLPDVANETLPEVYAAADLVVAPTQGARACGSLAALEAMSTGKPVIAAGVGGVLEIVVEGETGRIVPPGDVEALAGAVVDVLGDDQLCARLGAQGRARAVHLFDGPTLNARMEAFLALASARAR